MDSNEQLLSTAQSFLLTPHELEAGKLDRMLMRVAVTFEQQTQRSIDRFINALRNIIEPDPQHPTHLQTIREIGYKFEA